MDPTGELLLKGECMALKQRSDILAEHRVPIIAFVWRSEEIIPSVIQMAHRTGSRAIFDFSMMGVEGLRSFLRKADPAGHVRDIKISVPTLMDPSLGRLLKETGGSRHLGRMPPPVFSRRSFRLSTEIEGIVGRPLLLSNHRKLGSPNSDFEG
jgi:hypothetical protein